MPEISEVARIVHHLRQHLVGRTLTTVTAIEDTSVFGKVGTSGTEFVKAMEGKKVVGAGQQGKYFWLVMDRPPHPVFHFGMTGWWHIRGIPTYYYASKESLSDSTWPPKFSKFTMDAAGEPKVETAFVDARRFARVRLLDCEASMIRNTTPLKENGPDPVIDRDVVTEDWLAALMKRKHVPVKALLLDQANISGIGNWVGDEVLYNARIHPEQYSDTLSAPQLKALHKSIIYICSTSVSLLGDSSKFPEDWLFNYRWGKGKKDIPTTGPGGQKITFLTVGGRTSCVVPSVQKKSGAIGEEDGEKVAEEKGGAVIGDAKVGKNRKRARDKQSEIVEEVKAVEEQENLVSAKKVKKGKPVAVVETEAKRTTSLSRTRRGKAI